MTPTIETARPATAAELPDIAALLARVFPDRRSWLSDLEWEYLKNPSGKAWYVNARGDDGAVVAHYAVMALPPIEDPRYQGLRSWFPLNTAVRPGLQVPGLMVATARSLFKHLETLGPSILLAVGNENASLGLHRLLGFQSLGPLELRCYAPWALPEPGPPRLLRADDAFVRWRVSRPGAEWRALTRRGAILRRIHVRGLPIDGVLTVGLPEGSAAALSQPGRAPRSTPAALRLYASFGFDPRGGVRVPERLRPSPLHYAFRLLAPQEDPSALRLLLMGRRFEFIDFDVV